MNIADMTLEQIIERMSAITNELKTASGEALSALEKESEALIARKLELVKEKEDEIKRTKLNETLKGGVEVPEAKTITPADDMIERTAFMNYVTKGVLSDTLVRAADQNVAADLGVMLPKTIQQSIITDRKSVV